jgi:hypothetical protein
MVKAKRMSRLVSASAALAFLAAAGCSGGAHSTNVDVMLPAPVCGGDAPTGTGPTCWATNRIATRTGCSDMHCVRDGGVLARAPLYAACGIAAPDPASPAPASALIGAAGAFSLDDDLCEFHAVVVPSCAGSGTAVSFDVELATKSGEAVPPGAAPYAEAFLTPIHIAQDTGTGTEMAPGRYRIGPVSFDASGMWTVTLHVFGACSDNVPQSPHAHLTLLLQVP